MKGLYLSGLLTGLLLQYDFGHCTELSLLWYTVGHIEIETLRHHQLVLGLLVLSAAHDLLCISLCPAWATPVKKVWTRYCTLASSL